MVKLSDAILYSTGCNYCKSTVSSVQLFTFSSVLTVTDWPFMVKLLLARCSLFNKAMETYIVVLLQSISLIRRGVTKFVFLQTLIQDNINIALSTHVLKKFNKNISFALRL